MTTQMPMPRLASLPMYPAAGFDNNLRLWQAVAASLIRQGTANVPHTLTADPGDLGSHWRDDRLLLGQTCGYPYAKTLRGAGVQLVGALRYTAPGCDGIRYRSRLVCRAEDAAAGRGLAGFRGRVAAVNEADSQSGWFALLAAVAELPPADGRPGNFFSKVVLSGAHARSIELLRSGGADIAAIDCISHSLFQRNLPDTLTGLAVIGQTPSAPGLPLITSSSTTPAELAALRTALQAVAVDPALADLRGELLIDRFEVVPDAAYDEILRSEQGALARGIAL